MAQLLPVDEFDLIIFGGTGDLAMRKLLPALYHRDLDKQFTGASRIIAVGRSKLSQNKYLEKVESALRANLGDGEFDAAFWKSFAARVEYHQVDVSSPANWNLLVKTLDGQEERIRVAYLATAPSLFGPIAKGLKKNGLITANSRIVLEKPLGRDLESASKINDQVGKCFRENQIYRIDHYLGKETVQNLLALRFGNSLFEPLWNRGTIDHVQITVAEDLGTGGRAEFFDHTGTLRDMVQNHMLQLLCLVAMEAPASMHHEDIRSEKIKVLRCLRRITPETVERVTVRGQYRSGAIGDITTVTVDFYVGAHFGGFRAEMDHVLLLDMAIHSFDEARFLSGTDPVAVTAVD